MQIKMRYYCIPIKMAKAWNTGNTNAAKVVEQQELSFLVGMQMVQLLWKTSGSLLQTKHILTLLSFNHAP